MGNVQCFLLEPTGRYRRFLRRYVGSAAETSPACPHGYHDASVFIDTVEKPGAEEDSPVSGDVFPHDDPRWPTRCAACSYEFKPGDEWQLSHDPEHRRADTGELTTMREAPAGAMWFAPWYAEHSSLGSPIHQQERPGQPHLIVKTPAATGTSTRSRATATGGVGLAHRHVSPRGRRSASTERTDRPSSITPS